MDEGAETLFPSSPSEPGTGCLLPWLVQSSVSRYPPGHTPEARATQSPGRSMSNSLVRKNTLRQLASSLRNLQSGHSPKQKGVQAKPGAEAAIRGHIQREQAEEAGLQ